MSKHRDSTPPPQPLGAMQRTSIPWGRNPRTIIVDGVPIEIVDSLDALRRRSVLLDTDLPDTDADTEEIT